MTLVAAFASMAALAAVPARAQGPDAGAAPPDSAEVRRGAEEAQAEFERERVARLPWTWATASGECDEVVGRFCYWHDAGSGAWAPPPPDPEVAAAREALLTLLAEAARSIPGDGWIAGQRVRYLVEAGRPGEAAAAARALRADPGWSGVLEGYALHAAGDYAAAERAFDAALASLPAAERARWTDVALLLDPPLGRAWRRLREGGRELFARRLWWLADPLWSMPGNERRTEHLSRVTLARLQERARSAYDVAWGDDLTELTIRYGWPVGWERARPRSGTLGSSARPGVIAHDAPGGRDFLPPHDVFALPEAARPEDWPLTAAIPRSAYAPSYADSLTDLPHQLAVFRRDGRAVIVAAFETERSVDATLLVSAGPGIQSVIARGTGERLALRGDAPEDAAVVSVEARAERFAARSRYGLRLPAAPPSVSDILLLAPGAPLPESLDAAVSLARPTIRVAPGERLGVYFELYPPPGPGGAARLTASVRDDRDGLGRRFLGWFGLGGSSHAGALSWVELLPASEAPLSRAVAVTLPSLPPGRHAIVLEIDLPGGATARTERVIEVFAK